MIMRLFIIILFAVITYGIWSQEPDSLEIPQNFLEETNKNQDIVLEDTTNKKLSSLNSSLESPKSINTLPQQKKQSNINADTTGVIFGWKLDDKFVSPQQIDIDTDLVAIQIYNPINTKYVSNSFLGNYGSPYLPNTFFLRKPMDDLLFLNSYHDYFSTFDNTVYYNTRKPFTELFYINGGPKKERLESINILHTQNINGKTNLGFNLDLEKNIGQYKYLDVNNKTFKVWFNYTGSRYNVHTTYNLNRYQASENGGIIDSVYLIQELDNKLYPTNFSGSGLSPYNPYVYNRIRYYDAMISQRVKLFTINRQSDSLKGNKNVAEPWLSHVFIVRRASKMYTETSENQPAFPIYNHFYTNPGETYDSVAQLKILNKLQLDFKTRFKGKSEVGIFANINYELNKYSYYSLMDSTKYYDTINQIGYNPITGTFIDKSTGEYRYDAYINKNGDTIFDINKNLAKTNIFIGGGLYGNLWGHFQGEFSGTLYLSGEKAGQTMLDGSLVTNAKVLGRSFYLTLTGSIHNIAPSCQLNYYYSNNYIWENDFGFINKVHLSSKLEAPSNKFAVTANYSLFRNYIYWDESGPIQYDGINNIMAFSLEKGFSFWKIHMNNKVYFQVSENKNVIEVPSLVVFNSTYFDNTWVFKLTNGRLQTMTGFDIYYNSAFNGYNYIPALSLFYQNENEKIGNYPYIDFWLNVKLKQVRFFAKYQHANSEWFDKNRYNAISYPANEKMLTIGIAWTFYD